MELKVILKLLLSHKKKPKHTLLNTCEDNGTLGTPFFHYELKPSLYQMTEQEKHVKINCLYSETEEHGLGLV